VDGRAFTVLEEYKGELGICVKVEKELRGLFLGDSRFFRTPYIGKHGWVTLKVYAAALNWARNQVSCAWQLPAQDQKKQQADTEPLGEITSTL
jgi:hypothetical protein